MSVLRVGTIEKIFYANPEYRKIDTFIETGTFKARTIRNMRGVFDDLHTIELSEELHKAAVEQYWNLAINFHLGDSEVLLPEIAERIDGPIFFYLDAHGFNRPNVAAGFPLWRELDYIRNRDQADIVAIDDLHAFGTKSSEPGDRVESGWAKLTPRAVLDYLGPERNLDKMTENNALIIFRKAKV